MFSQTVEYALRAMVVLASRPRLPLTSYSIAVDSRVPPDYLIKVLQSLARSGFVLDRLVVERQHIGSTQPREKQGGHQEGETR